MLKFVVKLQPQLSEVSSLMKLLQHQTILNIYEYLKYLVYISLCSFYTFYVKFIEKMNHEITKGSNYSLYFSIVRHF